MNVLLGQKAYFQGEFAVTFREGTPPKTNIAPENGWMEDEVPFGMVYFQVSLLLVSGKSRWVNDFWSFFFIPLSVTRHLCPGPSVDHHCDEHQQDDHWYIGDLHKQ